jgi:hypothetical protein
MKTAKEKATRWAIDNAPDYPHYIELVDSLTTLLKEQDRDTRHASAESVLSLDGPKGSVGSEWVEKDLAHAAIMNTKAV